MIQDLKTTWQNYSTKRRIATIMFLVVFVIAPIPSALAYRHSKQKPVNLQSSLETNSDRAGGVSGAEFAKMDTDESHNKYRLYESPSGGKNKKTLYLVDSKGSLVRSDQIADHISLNLVLDDGTFILQDEDFDLSLDNLYDYYLYGKDGLKVVEPPEGIRDGNFGLTRMYPAGGSTVVFNRVTNPGFLGDDYEAELVFWDLADGTERVVKNKTLLNYKAGISVVSTDRKHIYFMGTSPDEQKKQASKLEALTSGEMVFEGDERLNEIYGWTVERALLEYDIATNTISAFKKINIENSYDQTLAVSPNGKYIIRDKQSSDSTAMYIINTTTGQEIKINNDSRPINPIYSPNGKRFAYIANETLMQKVVVVDTATGDSKAIETVKLTANNMNPAETVYPFKSLRWYTNEELDYSRFGTAMTYKAGAGSLDSVVDAPGKFLIDFGFGKNN